MKDEREWRGDLEYLQKPTNTAITDEGLFSDRQLQAMNDVTVNDKSENAYEMNNIAGSRNQRTDNRG